jgi:hypothetical protein
MFNVWSGMGQTGAGDSDSFSVSSLHPALAVLSIADIQNAAGGLVAKTKLGHSPFQKRPLTHNAA